MSKELSRRFPPLGRIVGMVVRPDGGFDVESQWRRVSLVPRAGSQMYSL
jgi:hypothetical protein